MLYALRYESHSNNDVSGLIETLKQRGVSSEHRAVCIIYFLIEKLIILVFEEPS